MNAGPFPGWDKGSPYYQTICTHGLHSEFEDSSATWEPVWKEGRERREGEIKKRRKEGKNLKRRKERRRGRNGVVLRVVSTTK